MGWKKDVLMEARALGGRNLCDEAFGCPTDYHKQMHVLVEALVILAAETGQNPVPLLCERFNLRRVHK